MPDLLEAKSIRIRDDWTGYAPEAPIIAHFDLQWGEGAFVGTAELAAGGYFGDTFSATEELTIPADVVTEFLLKLSQAAVEVGKYEIPPAHTDDYPKLSINITLDEGSVEFYSNSQNEDHTPWRFETSLPNGLCKRDCIIHSDVPAQALAILNPYLGRDIQENLIQQARESSP